MNLGQKLITIHSSEKPEMEIHLNQKLHEPKVFRNGIIVFSLFLSAEYVVILANMVIMMMINLRVCCENIAMSLKNCAIRAVFGKDPLKLCQLSKQICLCCAELGRALPLPRQNKRHQLSHQCSIRLHTLKREIISAQFFLSNNFRIIFRIRNIDAHNE